MTSLVSLLFYSKKFSLYLFKPVSQISITEKWLYLLHSITNKTVSAINPVTVVVHGERNGTQDKGNKSMKHAP